MSGSPPPLLHFGAFELDLESEKLLKNGRTVRLQPQPFRLLRFLVSQRGRLVTREEIRTALWKDETFVDFEQGVNFTIKQVREALGDRAESPIYIQTVPKRGYRFLAPVSTAGDDHVSPPSAEPELQRFLWENIVDLRLAEERRGKQLKLITVALVCLALAMVVLFFVRR